MLALIISIFGILVTILFVIGTHEYAHFMVARLLGVKVLRFSIGFGKALFRWQGKSGTEYVLALIPLGGYVKMLDASEGTVAPDDLPRAYNHQPFYKKCLIVLAGPLMNFLCAFLLYWIIFMVGFTTIKPVIGEITPSSIAAASNLTAQQEIIRIDHQPTRTWMSIMFRLLSHAGEQGSVAITVQSLQMPFRTTTHHLNLTGWRMDELKPDPLTSLGIIPYRPPTPLILGVITANSPAMKAGFKIGDQLLTINQQPLSDWETVMTLIKSHPEKTLPFQVLRQGKRVSLEVLIGYHRNLWGQKQGYLGLGPKLVWPANMRQAVQYSPVPALAQAGREILNFTYFNVMLIGKLVTGKLSLKTLGGPITIFESAGAALNSGFLSFTAFLAFLSLSIGLINLLPIPGLDGGHLFIQLIEFIIRRPLPEKVLTLSFQFGFGLLIFVLVQALINDLLRLY
ncbi:MAG: RIP metalloprotease RseP [Gammaproteobacteria bacterium RIFCSPHIGHO2_12_FULL_45_12]|nr:MAG: RIP metalloprotease RseP [Gammaproteobacteria bacterium RIFCSPHIGHO2_12_FULL_45_12]